MEGFEGRRLLVVGASASIGESIALEAAARGADVVVAARRKDKLDELVERAGGRAAAVVCDCSLADDCARVVEEAARHLGGLDWVVYTPAIFMLRDLEELTPEDWHATFDLNVIGAALVTRAAITYLQQVGGRAAYFVSVSTTSNPHWPGLGAYAISKMALLKLIECWRHERPEIGFTIVEVGDTEGSDGPVNGGWTPEQMERFLPAWQQPGRLSPELQSREQVANGVLTALSASSYIERISVVPRRG